MSYEFMTLIVYPDARFISGTILFFVRFNREIQGKRRSRRE